MTDRQHNAVMIAVWAALFGFNIGLGVYSRYRSELAFHLAMSAVAAGMTARDVRLAMREPTP